MLTEKHVSRRVLIAFGVALSLVIVPFACSPTAKPTRNPAASAPIAEENPPTNSMVLGIVDPTTKPSLEARKWNKRGLVAHRAGKHAEAIQWFSKAIKSSPEFRLARYNLACAHSKRGQAQDAWTLLRVLLNEDYPFTNRRIQDDPDLEALRQSSLYTDIRNELELVRAQREQDLSQGIWLAHTSLEEVGKRIRHSIWPGVYVPRTRRFLPLMQPYRYFRSEPLDETMERPHLLFDPTSQTMVILKMADWPNHGWGGVKLEVWDIATAKRSYETKIHEDDYGQILSLTLALNSKEIAVRGRNPELWSPWRRLPLRNETAPVPKVVEPWTGRGFLASHSRPPVGTEYLMATPSAGADSDGESSGPVLHLHDLPEKYQLKGNILYVGNSPIRLGSGHKSCPYKRMIESPQSKKVLIVSVCMSSFDDELDSTLPTRSFADEVDLGTGQVKPIVSGRGVFEGGYALDGTLLWRQYQSFDSSERVLRSDGLPGWVHFAQTW